MSATIESDGYTIVKCNACKNIAAEGFGDIEDLLEDIVDYEKEFE